MLHSSCLVQQSFEGGIYWKLYFHLHYLIQGDAETLTTTLTLYNLLKACTYYHFTSDQDRMVSQ